MTRFEFSLLIALLLAVLSNWDLRLQVRYLERALEGRLVRPPALSQTLPRVD